MNKFKKKLSLKKVTISKLNNVNMSEVKGGWPIPNTFKNCSDICDPVALDTKVANGCPVTQQQECNNVLPHFTDECNSFPC